METLDVLKSKKRKEQKDKCAVSGRKLKREPLTFDARRRVPKAKGGTLTEENIEVVDPIANMAINGNLRIRTKEEEELKVLIDGREHVRRFYNSLNNRLKAALDRKTDHLDKETEEWMKAEIKATGSQLSKTDKRIEKHLKKMNLPIINACLPFFGLGPITTAYLVTYIDIKEAKYASSLWKYVGFDKAAHERYTKGKTSGGNKTLRTVLYTMALSMIRTKAVYRDVYVNEKAKLEASEKMTKSRRTNGVIVECKWKEDTAGHRHGAATRKMMKHFLADVWYVWRTLEGLDTPHLYVEEKMGHTGIVRPQERGWIF